LIIIFVTITLIINSKEALHSLKNKESIKFFLKNLKRIWNLKQSIYIFIYKLKTNTEKLNYRTPELSRVAELKTNYQ
jgi:hypothetical protein